jgi:AbrB family looped-hinge helix DNA binding protein
MKERATVTSNGRITIPAPVRKALDLHQGDRVLFEMDESGGPVATLRGVRDFFAMAGSIPPRTAVPKRRSAERRLAREERARRPT